MTWKKAALEHALAEAPSEACGLLVRKGRRHVYWPCRNISPEPIDTFIIEPEDWADAEDGSDEILAIVHSHPEGTVEPSPADQEECSRSELPWHIVVPEPVRWGKCLPLSVSNGDL
jgi:proteasome lid subunit RPN8/RPN11